MHCDRYCVVLSLAVDIWLKETSSDHFRVDGIRIPLIVLDFYATLSQHGTILNQYWCCTVERNQETTSTRCSARSYSTELHGMVSRNESCHLQKNVSNEMIVA